MILDRAIRLAVLDDGLFVRTQTGEIRPLSATFNRFVEAVARHGAFAQVRYVVPVRDLRIWEVEPALDPIDEAVVDVVPTTFFSGIGDYLLRAGYVAWHNWPVIDQAIAGSDLLWLRLPASNALIALAAAHKHGVPHFGWVAGSARDVALAQHRPPVVAQIAAAIGGAYDAVTALAAKDGPLIQLDAELFASVVTNLEMEQTRSAMATPADVRQGPARIVWAGRMAGEKGLTDLIEATRQLVDARRDVRLVLIGDGPAHRSVERSLRRLPRERVEDYGSVGDRRFYMDLLRGGDVFAHPSRAEGVPKAVIEAMAAGLPVVATASGAVREILDDGRRGRVVPVGDPDALATAIGQLLDDRSARAATRELALDWAAEHTAEAQAERLIGRLRSLFPKLAWAVPDDR